MESTRVGLHIGDSLLRNKYIKDSVSDLNSEKSSRPVNDYISSIIESF